MSDEKPDGKDAAAEDSPWIDLREVPQHTVVDPTDAPGPMRWVRWRITGSSGWDRTFRVQVGEEQENCDGEGEP